MCWSHTVGVYSLINEWTPCAEYQCVYCPRTPAITKSQNSTTYSIRWVYMKRINIKWSNLIIKIFSVLPWHYGNIWFNSETMKYHPNINQPILLSDRNALLTMTPVKKYSLDWYTTDSCIHIVTCMNEVEQPVSLVSRSSYNAGHFSPCYLQWASYQIRKIADCACAGNAGNVFPATNFKGNR